MTRDPLTRPNTPHSAHADDVADLELVAIPATAPAGPADLEIRLDGVIVGDLDFRVCVHCQLAVIEHIRIDPPYRRRGLATRAVQVILAEHPDYRWSTSLIDDTAEARGRTKQRTAPLPVFPGEGRFWLLTAVRP